MHIKSIDIVSYGGLNEYSLNPQEGLNLLEGGNESGKSTVCDFIRFVFYGFSTKTERQRRIGWGGERACGSIILECDGKEYRVYRSVSYDGKSECEITDTATGQAVFEDLAPGIAFFGVPEDIFTRTAYISQTGGSRVEGEKISSAIENILLSGDEEISTKKALKILDGARVYLKHKIGNGGRLNELYAEREEKQRQLEEGAQNNVDIISKEGSIREYRKKTEENEKKLEELNKKIDYYETGERMKMVGKIFNLSAKRDELSANKEELDASVRTEEGFLPDSEYYSSLVKCRDNVKRLDEQIEQIQKTASGPEPNKPEKEIEFVKYLDEHEITGEKYRATKAKRFSLVLIGIITAIIACLGAGYGIFTFMADKMIGSIIALVSLGVLFIPLVIIMLMRDRYPMPDFKKFGIDKNDIDEEIKRSREAAEDYENAIRIRNDAEGRIKIANEEKDISLKESEELCEKIREKDIDTAIEKCKDYLEKKDALDRTLGETVAALTAAVEQFGGEEKINELVKYAESISLSDEGLAAIDIDRVTKERNFIDASQQSMQEFMTKVNNELLVLKATNADIDKLSDEVQSLDNEIRHSEFKFEAVALAHEMLGKAGETVRKDISPRLSKRAGEYMSYFTDGKYSDVGVSDKLSMRYETSSGGSREIDFMSAGTMDLAYISLRFALIELLYEKENPPVIFDESFSRLDDKRLHDTMTLLKRVSADEGTQIFILTSSGRDAIALDGLGSYNRIKM